MTDTWTDDAVAELFASADPAAPTRRPVSGDPGLDPIAEPEHGAIVVELGDQLRSRAAGRQRERWSLVVGVAATVALVVSLLVNAALDLDRSTPADTSNPDPPDIAAFGDLGIVDEWIAALNDHDAQRAATLTAPAADVLVVPADWRIQGQSIELGDQFAWLGAFDWKWENVQCDETTVGDEGTPRFAGVELEMDARLLCSIDHTNVVIEQLDLAPISGTATFALLDGRVVGARAQGVFAHTMVVLGPMLEWAEEAHPDDVDAAWDDLSPIFTAEAAAINGRLVSEFLALNGDEVGVRGAYQFIAALNDGDAEAARAVLVPGHVPELVNADNVPPPTLDAQIAWLRAFGTTWADPRCTASTPTIVSCHFEFGNRLADAQTGRTGSATVRFMVEDGALELMNAPSSSSGPDMSYDAFIYWVNVTDPEVAHQIWVDGDSGQIVTEESARLLDEQLTAYLASGAVSLEQDEAPTQALVDALEARDANALDDAVTADVGELAGWLRSDWAVMLAWMDANDESWIFKACNPADVDVHGCEIDAKDALTRTAGLERPLFARVEVDGGRVSAISISDQSDDYAEQALQPFLDWLQATHPDEFTEVWTSEDGRFVPRPTARAAELHAGHIVEYTTAESGS